MKPVTWLLSLITTRGALVGPTALFWGGGYLGDKILGTGPYIMIIGVTLGFLATDFWLFKKALNKIKN